MCQLQRRHLKEPQLVSLNENVIVEWSHMETHSVIGVDALLIIVEELRIQLTQLVIKKGTFLDEEVVQLSQHLDKYVLLIQQLQSI
ncbi:aspartyl-phosphate phosphatase Spo0E family protein [Aneurinibacillus sp. Ricciae_BoGa-3]|uniref:aspartyl-phosphate phosphatase Spo0E family protein n=1 Tax=Aneurinibacillus sp. Ricciae_BoGa-3 TaxID=3022697 RepID=UPI002341C4AF|nr:aspartyl-phosphate phosphatase Spo0E family protein [Aneurinibacillus sp. Ricciae_BoGa-3]WCK54484.1 aspartyl-phosphate phosphatase Spo0E family protein [Aneurinibacillus sp. Ricciae_BoGa-3]